MLMDNRNRSSRKSTLRDPSMLNVTDLGSSSLRAQFPPVMPQTKMAKVDSSSGGGSSSSIASSSSSSSSLLPCDATGCSNAGVHLCSACHVTRYCSQSCQSVHWKTGGHRYECKISSETGRRALANQDLVLDRLDADYYVFIPNRGGAHGLEFGNEVSRAAFLLLRLRALYSPYCVWRMYVMLKHAAEEACLSNLVSDIREQLYAEYGVDPIKAEDCHPAVGEITEEDFDRIQESLENGRREARLLAAQPPPNETLQRQNQVLTSDFSSLNGIQYMIFDARYRDVAVMSKKTVNIEIFKILRKRASISPQCLKALCAIIENAVIHTQEDSAYKTHLKSVLRQQLQAEHGMDPYASSRKRSASSSASEEDVCQDVAQFATATMAMTSPT